MFYIKEKPVFLSAPIEVSFYSQSHHSTDQSLYDEAVKGKAEYASVAQEQLKEETEKKENIVVKKINIKEKKSKYQVKTDIKKTDKQFVKSVENKKSEVAKPQQGNNSGVETFSLSSSDKHFGEQGSSYEGLSFDNQSFKYSYYTGQIIRKIGRQWRWAENYGKLRTLVYFKIHRDGTVFDISIKESSGSMEYDKNALDTIRRAAPFPDLPENYDGQALGVFFEFKYKN
ncbi:MAG: TonB family protein [Endomicrobium sp.]|nr:TonB family protein [Endomicrobium sp.]